MPGLTKIISLTIVFLCIAAGAHANNLSISNVTLGKRDPAAKTVVIGFQMSWENSWRNKINHDAAWLTLRLHNTAASPAEKKLCRLTAAGVNPSGSSTGTGSNLEFYVPADKAGVFVRRSANGNVGPVSMLNAQLTIDYASCGFSDADQVAASIFGLEMVYIPQGAFKAGDFNGSTASLNRGSADSSPWPITSENSISVANTSGGGFRYVSAGNAGEYATGAAFTIPQTFPKGYQPFYAMKYELNEGQWVEFLNALPTASRARFDVTDNAHKNSDSVVTRNTIACSGVPLACTTQRPARSASFLTWNDLAAFLDWAALRPLTELEFEKMSRGPLMPVSGEYVWGSTDATAADALSTPEDGAETVSTNGANAAYGSTTLSGGDASSGPEYQTGALRNGIFATANSTRVSAGAAYYGVLDLAGNVKERVVTIGNAEGLSFTGAHGDGELSADAGYEGNANSTAWPGSDTVASRGVTGAAGTGFKGGSWEDSADYLRTSDRTEAALTTTISTGAMGGRGVRTYDGN